MHLFYSREQLLDFNSPHLLTQDVFNRLNDLHISAHVKSRRGKRGGRRKQRPISVITDIFDINSFNQLKKGVVKSNLINVHPKPKPVEIKIRLLNTQSVRNKTTEISDNIIEDDIDLFFITESWL
ncbi:hypothetical protein SNE40_009747 [Patella caerulea]|uniref:Uncharacterized protein n=1 Tax=Patella caerulea TaxID=87958 RepID=A0AAN8JRY3_PATCE